MISSEFYIFQINRSGLLMCQSVCCRNKRYFHCNEKLNCFYLNTLFFSVIRLISSHLQQNVTKIISEASVKQGQVFQMSFFCLPRKYLEISILWQMLPIYR